MEIDFLLKVHNCKTVYIFGAGKNGKLLMDYLKETRIAKVAAFIDNDENKQGEIYGIKCISVDEAVKRGAREDLVIISPDKRDEIENKLKEQGFSKLYCPGLWIRKLQYFRPVIWKDSDYRAARPFNHYESPYPDITEIHRKEKILFDRSREVLDIDFNIRHQMEMIEKMKSINLPEWSEKKDDKYRYYYNNQWFEKGSADALCYLMQIIKPKNIVEVGSGYSTAVMLDTNEICFENRIDITCIEPRADRLNLILRRDDEIQLYEKDLQEIPVKFFEKLDKDDMLFIDSSHVSKMNSDVNYIFFEILPRLKEGVYIHFHDVYYPFIYPEKWIYEGRIYNEMYVLRAFLMNNKKYSVQFFGDMLTHNYGEKMPKNLMGVGIGSLWIKKES